MLPLLVSSTKLTGPTDNNNYNNRNNNKLSNSNNNSGSDCDDGNATTTSEYRSGPVTVIFVGPPPLAPSLIARIGRRVNAAVEFLGNRLLSDAFHTHPQSSPLVAEILYPAQCAEKAVLLKIPFQPVADLSTASSTDQEVSGEERQCRICLLPIAEKLLAGRSPAKRRVIAPCRCAGSVQYVHIACLTHWIDISTRKAESAAPHCELCGFRFRRKPLIDPRQLHFPYVDWCDRILNLLFLFLVAVMVLCGWVAVHYLCISERRPLIRYIFTEFEFLFHASRNTNTRRYLTDNDVTVIIASILFLAAFFIALFTQYRADVTVWRIITRLWATNRNWRIRDYDPQLDDVPPPAAAMDGGECAIGASSKASDIVTVEFVVDER